MADMARDQKHRSKRFTKYFREYYQLYLMILPAVAFILIFAYYPMYGAQIAFRNYKIKLGIWNSPWVGFKYFERFMYGANFWPLLRNTLGISLYSLAVGFPAPILLSFMLNELRSQRLKKAIQMITYAPHFISTVAVCGMMLLFLDGETGIVNLIIEKLGGSKHNFMTDASCFQTVYVLSGVWQGLGWGTIIYLAALSSVDVGIIEAARIDGANRFQKIFHIDLPSVLPTIVILLVLQAGRLLSVGYEKILLLQNALNMSASDVISTYVYRLGIEDTQYSFTTAIGLFNSIANIVLLVLVNTFARKLGETSLW